MTNPFLRHLLRHRPALPRVATVVTAALSRAGLVSDEATRAGAARLLGRFLNPALDGVSRPTDAVPPGKALLEGSFTGPEGTRPYRLFVPPSPAACPALIVMLHGCTQTAEDFAAGTRMNDLARAAGALVLYPEQIPGANPQRCWNWFAPAAQQRAGGEAALLAGMVRSVMAAHSVDPGRVFVAGLSAGGAMAANLGAAYPELFAAIGVHSGLAAGAATDMAGAFAAMRQGRAGSAPHTARTIVFHGDKDATVAPRNGELVARQVSRGGRVETLEGRVPDGLSYTRALEHDASGRVVVERWIVHGAGHAWSGGATSGSYTEPQGPDASAAMLDFFLAAA